MRLKVNSALFHMLRYKNQSTENRWECDIIQQIAFQPFYYKNNITQIFVMINYNFFQIDICSDSCLHYSQIETYIKKKRCLKNVQTK